MKQQYHNNADSVNVKVHNFNVPRFYGNVKKQGCTSKSEDLKWSRMIIHISEHRGHIKAIK
jgi:hypothetical protein